MINILLLIISYCFMEFVAWSNHKYVMHGFLWKWHKDHHTNDLKKNPEAKIEKFKLEKNDRFFIIYALPAIILMILGFSLHYFYLVSIGIGITLYGFTYFVIHDLMYHKRIRIPFIQTNHNRYSQAIIDAHTAHHKPKDAKDFNNYGLLIFSFRYFKK